MNAEAKVPTSPAPRTWWTIQEVANRWRVSKMTVYRMCHSGELEHVRVRRQFRISRTAVLKYEEGHRLESEPS